MADPVTQTSVLIAGAGPVGLALACELGLRGIDCVVVEKRDGKLHVPKMSLVSAGGMEFCRRWGIAETVRTAVWSEHHALDFVYMETLAGAELTRIKIPSYAQKRPDWSPEGMCQCPQIFFDPILAARVAQLEKVTFLYNTSVEDFAPDAGGVTVTITAEGGGATRQIRAKYLVGCDGASSMIRNKLGIALEGAGAIASSVNIFFRSPQLETMHDKGWARIYRAIDEEGCWSELIPIDGKELWRLTVFDDPRYETDPHAALRRVAGFDLPCEIISTLLWERRDSVAERYGSDRVWLAGDAVHQSSPTGGAGMHTGLEEAVNLAWKLEAVLKGWGGPRLLASYEAERKPVAERNIELSTLTYRALRSIPPTPAVRTESAWRTTELSSYSIPDHVRTCPALENFPDLHRRRQPCAASCAGPADCLNASRCARAARVAGAGSVHAGPIWNWILVLLRLGKSAPDAAPLLAAAAARGVPIREVAIEDESVAKLHEKPLVLIRPDFHVAWRGDDLPADTARVVDVIRGG